MNVTTGTYRPPEYCEKCGSHDIAFRASILSNGALSCRYICITCGHESNMLPKIENLNRRTNSSLANWRKNVWKRDGCRCVICGSQDDLNVHHIIPVSVSEEYKYTEGNGITLCRVCHRLAHISNYDINRTGVQNG